MPAKPKTEQSPAALRRRAEKLVAKPAKEPATSEARRLLHELDVHQIELEMQNAELRLARDESEALLEKYTELYDFAPVGYFTLAADGTIRLANLTGAAMVGVNRSQLNGRSFSMLVASGQRTGFKAFLKRVFAAEEKVCEEFGLANLKRASRIVTIEARRGSDGQDCSAMVVDITGSKLAVEMSQRNAKLKQEIVHRQRVEEDLRANRLEQSRLLRQSRSQQKQLRDLSHRMLDAQEEERKRISRELHDVITQTLVGINVHLAVLSQGATALPKSLQKQIDYTQSLVLKAVQIVHRFARDLRPAMLDDLGLIPALQAYMKQFLAKTGIRVSLQAHKEIDQSPAKVRTVLYRIAQEALTNVARHAKAGRVEIGIEVQEKTILMTIRDDGQGFVVGGTAATKKKRRLGLVGMKERAEMIGGTFQVESAPGRPDHRARGNPQGVMAGAAGAPLPCSPRRNQ
jgi:PAS domain S-box-containing protein